MKTTLIRSLMVLLFSLMSSWAFAQSWPTGPVRIIVPYPPGAEPDVMARDVANQLSRISGKTVIVENKPGANSIIGTDVVAKGEGDGSLLLMVDRLAVITNPILYSKLSYTWERQLKPVTDLGSVHLFIAASPGLPVKNLRELVAYAKAKPKSVNAGIAGNGHVNHIGMEMLAQSEGMALTYVPYKGMAPTITGFLGDEVGVMMAGGLVMQQMSKAKPIKILAIGDDKRAAYLPDVPTIVEAGGKSGSIPSTVFSFFAPGKTSDETIAQMNRAIVAVVTADFKKTYNERGVTVMTSSPEEMLANMKRESAKYEKIIREVGIKLD